MSGHSRWQQIHRKKAITDTRRGRLFTQVSREITIAAKMGGGDPGGNARLRFAVEKAKSVNMPAENVKRAIMRGTGELPGVSYEDVVYEVYGPGGVAIIIEAITDNKNRTIAEIRHLLERYSGKLAASGAVAYQFHKKGIISIPVTALGEDDLMALILEAGADDMKTYSDCYTIITPPNMFETVRKNIEEKRIPIERAELQLIPESTTKVGAKETESVMKLIDALEENEDVQHVYTNADMDEATVEKFHTN
jgi:YebC/PmpR family DNA-binding regulatory protein